ncbi:hypothetical protein WDV06_22685 [Streptomyces racemochromogenes]|uniref:Integral membrane protein n=1 Tax=Streptomyces racemochromogenes TaxID=67353 RepID=A0ABW7PHL9_9ACTN
MGRGFTHAGPGSRDADAASSGPRAHDLLWAAEMRSAVGVASLLCTALFCVDAASGRLDVTRGALWTGLAFLVFAIMLPHRVSVRPGLLSARRMLGTDTVRTDSLVSVRWSDGVSQRLILRDAQGGRVEIDPAVLVRNPAVWHLLDTDSRTSIRRGTLREGAAALRELARRIDRETARTVFKVSGMR